MARLEGGAPEFPQEMASLLSLSSFRHLRLCQLAGFLCPLEAPGFPESSTTEQNLSPKI